MSRYKFTNGTSTWGAQMGRRPQLPSDATQPRKLKLEQMRLVDGAYDNGGAYWGMGTPLWVAHDEETEIVVRGADRAAAKVAVLAILPTAKFYR